MELISDLVSVLGSLPLEHVLAFIVLASLALAAFVVQAVVSLARRRGD